MYEVCYNKYLHIYVCAVIVYVICLIVSVYICLFIVGL